ncbi:PorT family protein [Bacteroidales bacterium OttesenSCG-928-B11]|nr:PorT family protein [Bacteroidales bacterium OttesenSCG-928-C03]MDL2312640.1 PorT family protein [Bacteroidales bacterium OttesenSCG-928-B11]MDL2326110.1 PorT family protein [Bacteroidales bacterium OttesenSCG-928-A14]
MKKLFFFFIVLASIASVNAQENQNTNLLKGHSVGVKSGILFSNRFSTCSLGEYNQHAPTIGTGYKAGFTYNFTFQNGLTLGADLAYNIKRYHSSIPVASHPSQDLSFMQFESIFQHHFLELPLKIGYITGKKWSYFINGGIAPGIEVFYKSVSTITFIQSGEISKKTYKHIPDPNVSLDAILETGVGYTLNNFLIYLSVNGECNIIPMNNRPYICQDRLYSFGFDIGVKYKIR